MDDATIQPGESLSGQTVEQVDYERYGFGPDGAPIRRRSETIHLAVLDMPQGTRIEFLGAPGEDGIGVVELGSDSDVSPTFCQEHNLSFLDMYTRLVPKDVPVPEMLLRDAAPTDTDYEQLRKKYPSQEYIEDPIQIPDDQLDIVSGTPVVRGLAGKDCGSWNCNQGTQAFQAFACQGSFPGSTIMWCDASPQYNFRDRWTNYGRRFSLSITAVCNTQIGYVRHYHRMPGWWDLLYDTSLPQNHWCWVRWKGVKRARWVRHAVLNTPAGAYFRAFTAMHN